jgi:crossover junction endodeoxyribonuclease RusA
VAAPEEWLIDIFVPGIPAPQGSKMARPIAKGRGEAKVYTGKVAMVESSKHGVIEWRNDVRKAATDAWGEQPPLDGGLVMDIRFIRRRPVSLPKRPPTPPATSRPDLSHLVRASEDALTSAGVWVDDARVVGTWSSKRYAEIGERTGARIRIRRARPGEDV